VTWDALQARVRAWIDQDPDPQTCDELEGLLAQGPAAEAALSERFQGPLAFGTAGLRGILGAGETRMNRAVVIRTSHGLGRWLLENDPEAKRRGVVIGYDGRILSRELAEETAVTLAAMEIPAHLSPVVTPTPVLAYAVERLDAAAGVMVTASHNPPEYNGYKVYAGNGAQIVPPQDDQIAALIASAPGARDVPRSDPSEARAAGLIRDLAAEVTTEYMAAVRARAPQREQDDSLSIVYTALHGVGGELVPQALAQAGFAQVHPVPEQNEPDGRFPTVAFPNPEEDGALDLALALAKANRADLILANDPDVDRLAACVRVDDDYLQLTGNDLGVLLGHDLLSQGSGPRLVMNTIVSSPLLGRIAAAQGVQFEETLTGFKWIANRAIEAEREGVSFVFGYEEALGYTVGNLVHDKDGIGAAVALAQLAAALKAKGQTLLDRLAEICAEHGLYMSGQRTAVFPGADGAANMAALMEGLRTAPPIEIGGLAVRTTRDYQTQLATDASGEQQTLSLPRSNVVAFDLAGGNRVIARPSGTEPKIKLYLDVCEPLGEGSYAAARERAQQRLQALGDDFAAKVGI
jgi:phosphomannomutase